MDTDLPAVKQADALATALGIKDGWRKPAPVRQVLRHTTRTRFARPRPLVAAFSARLGRQGRGWQGGI